MVLMLRLGRMCHSSTVQARKKVKYMLSVGLVECMECTIAKSEAKCRVNASMQCMRANFRVSEYVQVHVR